jgi:hypothetical protein
VQREPSLLLFAGAELPLFRVALSDGSDVYISPTSGEVVMRGSRLLWAIRFAFYRLHVWKWSDAPGPHRSYWLLGLMAGLLVLSSGSGLIVALRLARRR